ncbi:MAG TPA: biotin--[acetyl-CoA-carboxylase] ligase [Fodinibius sp.]|nr:biotin--[acetyl-CoA-carboxylase] ligase [Fodinibius sp.]
MSNLFDLSSFKHHLSTHWLGQDFRYFETVPSTNTYIKKLTADSVQHGTVVLADNQTRGRGQYQREWEIDPNENLTFSIVLKPTEATGIHTLTLACALCIVEMVDNLEYGTQVSIKWPNDVRIKNKKVAGLLTESVFLGNKIERLIIGIGININQRKFSGELHQKATSLRLATGRRHLREQLLNELLRRIEFKYHLWNRKLPVLYRQINRKIEGYGQWIRLVVDGKVQEDSYKLLGINEAGMLLLLNREGGIESFSYEQIRIITN